MNKIVKGSDLVLCYCKKCGRIVQEDYGEAEQVCDYCQSSLHFVPIEYTCGQSGTVINNDLKKRLTDDYIKSSPEFDPYLFEHRDEDLYNRRMENRVKLEHGKAILEEKNRLPQCPSCGSTNISKIGLVSRVVSTQFWGLASNKIGSTYKCKNCGTTW